MNDYESEIVSVAAADRVPNRRGIRKRLRALWPMLALMPIGIVMVGSSRVWVFDLAIAGFWWIWCPLFIALCVRLLRRRSVGSGISVLVCLLLAWPVGGSRPVFRPHEPAHSETNDVSMLIFNSDMGNPTHDLVAPFILKQDADVVVILEPVWEFYAGVVKFGMFDAPYPFSMVRPSENEMAPRILVVSRWELSAPTDDRLRNADGMVCVVNRPEDLGGSFLVAVAHPPSPRNPQRWQSGNRSVRHLAALLRSLNDSGERVILAADLNATPGSIRDRILSTQAGMTRAKPVFGRWGSFPASWGLGRIAIDDAWCPPEILVRSWKTIAGPGSDHRAIRVVFSIPRRNNAP